MQKCFKNSKAVSFHPGVCSLLSSNISEEGNEWVTQVCHGTAEWWWPKTSSLSSSRSFLVLDMARFMMKWSKLPLWMSVKCRAGHYAQLFAFNLIPATTIPPRWGSWGSEKLLQGHKQWRGYSNPTISPESLSSFCSPRLLFIQRGTWMAILEHLDVCVKFVNTGK